MKRQYLFGLFLLMTGVMAACAPKAIPSTQVSHLVAETPTLVASTSTETAPSPSETPDPHPAGWPLYTLATQLPEAPAQVRLYQQAFPAAMSTDERLTALMKRLKITGEVQTRTIAGGVQMISVMGGPADMYLWSDDPLIVSISDAAPPQDITPRPIAPDVRAAMVKAYLNERKLLDFPYIMEPPDLSPEKDWSIRVVPLIDNIPLYDYDPLYGRMLVTFNPSGKISLVSWQPLKLVAGDNVEIVPAAKAWQQFVNGETPKKTGVGRCWQASVYDSRLPYGAAEILDRTAACVSWDNGARNSQRYTTATITDVKLVYFTTDLNLGMSPFTRRADLPLRAVYPMWQFSGSTSDGRELLVLWPAMSEK